MSKSVVTCIMAFPSLVQGASSTIWVKALQVLLQAPLRRPWIIILTCESFVKRSKVVLINSVTYFNYFPADVPQQALVPGLALGHLVCRAAGDGPGFLVVT